MPRKTHVFIFIGVVFGFGIHACFCLFTEHGYTRCGEINP
jgi:hypothetical protein